MDTDGSSISQSNRRLHGSGMLLYLLPLFELILGAFFLGMLVSHIQQSDLEEQRHNTDVSCMTYTDRIMADLKSGMAITDSLEQIVISEDGRCDKFYKVAKNLTNPSIESIQLAPAGFVSYIYPEASSDLSRIDQLDEEAQGEYARYAKNNDITSLQGPYDLKDGSQGIVARNPIFLERHGRRIFWGFAIVIIRVPDIFSDSLTSLDFFGYQYRLLKTTSPWDPNPVEFYHSEKALVDPVSHWFSLGGDLWELQLMPNSAWAASSLSQVVLWTGFVILSLLAGLTWAVIRLEERRKYLRYLSETDKLTGIYNRSGFDDQLDHHIRRHPDEPCIVAELDIDNFKFINDLYGHPTGDRALQTLVSSLRRFFASDVIIGRNGGDEFCLLLPGETLTSVAEKLRAFCAMPKTFACEDQLHAFTISMGYVEYPTQASNRVVLMRYADAALYEVKLHGKNGCKAYEDGFNAIRTQLGFRLNDTSTNLPSAFIIYRADPTDDELLYANREMLRLTGCDDIQAFFDYTKRSFRNLVAPSEQDSVQTSVWAQVNADCADIDAYVRFSLVRHNGSLVEVLGHGRIVEHSSYGRLFYCSSRMKRSNKSTIRYDVMTGVQRAAIEYTVYSVPALRAPAFSVT